MVSGSQWSTSKIMFLWMLLCCKMFMHVPRGKIVCGQDGFYRRRAKQICPAFCMAGLPGVFQRLKRVWEFTRERGSVQNFQNFYWQWISSIQEKLEDLWQKGCEFGSSGLACSSPPVSGKKPLSNSASKTMSTMLLSHFENRFNSIHLNMFHVLSISESTSRGNRIPRRPIPGGFTLSWIPLLPSIWRL